jgi:DNA-directed RNA polymerase specialized sigma24 family protein
LGNESGQSIFKRIGGAFSFEYVSSELRMDTLAKLLVAYQETGDLACAEKIVEVMAPRLGRFLRSRIRGITPKSTTWEDVLQETLSDIIECLPAVENPNALESICFAVARNVAAEQFRASKMELHTIVDTDFLREMLSELTAETLSASDSITLKEAHSLLETSKPPCIYYLWDRYVVGLSFPILGDTYGITKEAAEKRVKRCLDLVRKLVVSERRANG